ncbi:HAD family phosphatase [Pseudovibrio sp. JE062]|uniref:HAD family hydrolase n=1 Tax=Pseudovibrio sp. JE062 TaxID=439495 RepID=UPI000186BD4A|nr:HAD family phosphatase [Pseudovibrio sp. JE062]EEA91927.1 HAD-superfamily hydrolase, subfamily IA, variant 3 [Pseudovibrio sp. JE062]
MFPVPLDAVIFDMDGLLLDTERLYRAAIFGACKDLGHTMHDLLHLSLIGTPKEIGDAKLKAHFGDGFAIDKYHERCRDRFRALCATSIPLRPGASEILDWLKELNIPRAVATSTPRMLALDHLDKAGVIDRVDAVVTRTDVEFGKPHPETFLKAAAAVGGRPSQCLALEDSHTGIRAATAAGMVTVMVPDLLEPTEEIRDLGVSVVPSLDCLLSKLRSSIDQSEQHCPL